jgi:hypothetical protein
MALYGQGKYNEAYFGYNIIATLTITSHSRNKISDETGFAQCIATFVSDEDLLEWIARAGGTGPDSGLLVGSGSTVTKEVPVQFEVDYNELTEGDKEYTIYVYGRSKAGWSDQ